MMSGLPGLYAADKPVIHWLNPDFPPVFIASGPHKGRGYGDEIIRYIEDHLPEYKHVSVTANLTRIYAQMTTQDAVCSAALFHTPERAAFATFSQDVYHVITNRVVVMKDKADLFTPYLNRDGNIDISRLVHANHLALGVVPDRFYSELINKTLSGLGKPDHMVIIPFDRYGALLTHGRIDYTFGFPAEAQYLFRKLDRADAFTAFPIAGEANFQSGGVSCSDKPIGRTVIDRINVLIAAEDISSVYDGLYEQWLDARSLKDYRELRAKTQR